MGQSQVAPAGGIIDALTTSDAQARVQTSDSVSAAHALQGLIGIESLQHDARLAGAAGAALLLLAGLVGWLGTEVTRLDTHWLAWAGLPAALAAIGGPLLAAQLLSRRALTSWRLLIALVMTVCSLAWIFAGVVAAGLEPYSSLQLSVACLGLAVALLPNLHWLPGLIGQLGVQLLFLLVLAYSPDAGLEDLWLPVGIWLPLALLAVTAGLYARRIERGKAELHYLRLEAAALQQQLGDDEARLREAEGRRQTLEAELAEILDLAEDASRTKTEFLATMSHEIRTPLNGILPILEMLRDTPLNEEQLKLVQTAQNSSRHLLRIINDILDFAKVDSGKLQLETIEVNIRDLVNSVTELMSGSARNRNLKLSASVSDKVPQAVRGDPIRLRQVLINLVSNAIKFTEEGGIRVEVSRGKASQKEVELLFAVADTGIGMSADTADRLFQSFSQADASTTRKHGGTGLGLVICKRLVELMDGRIGVRSTLGQGSTFWFLVPLRKSVVEVPSARRDLKGVRILTLIRDPDGAAKVARKLRDWGVIEEPADDPADALAKLRSASQLGKSWTYELALIDGAGLERRLPGLFAELRSIDALKRMPVVVALRSETLAHKLKRDYGVLVLADALRPEPLRRILHRLFDVESNRFGTTGVRAGEVYDDLNVSVDDIGLDTTPVSPEAAEFSGRVLLVEDNPVNLGVVKKALSRLGLRCDTAIDGKEALTQFEAGRFDIVFMDCQMPVMDGYEATRRIRRLEQSEGRLPTPVVAMTANAMEGDRDKCIKAGMDDYLAKPVSLPELRATVSSWLGRVDEAKPQSPPVEQRPAGSSGPVLDDRVLGELREIMADDYLGLLRTFLRNAPELVVQAQHAIALGDVHGLVVPVHSLKSSSANVGAMQVSELARRAEREARNGNLAAAGAAFAAVDAAYREAAAALERHIAACSAA